MTDKVGVPDCWNCGDSDSDSSARRTYCRVCDANLHYGTSFGPKHQFRPRPRGAKKPGATYQKRNRKN